MIDSSTAKNDSSTVINGSEFKYLSPSFSGFCAVKDMPIVATQIGISGLGHMERIDSSEGFV